MIALKKILHPTDFSPTAEQALPYALFLARQFNAELHLLHAVVLFEEDPYNPAYHFPDKEELYRKLSEMARERMQTMLDGHDITGITLREVERRGISAAEVILDYAAEEDMDLIVMGTHGRRGIKHLILGSVAEEVVRKALCPVMTVRYQEKPRPVDRFETILVPVDFSGYSRISLIHARELAQIYGAKLHLLHVIEDTAIHPAFYNTGVFSIRDLRPNIDEEARQLLEKFFRETPGPEVEAEFFVEFGRATHKIPAFAEEKNSDLIVMSTHGLTGLAHVLIGSVTEKVVRLAPCPVLTLKAFGKTLIPKETLEEVLASITEE